MAVIIPEEDELRSRVLAHLQARSNNPFVAAVWHGYFASLLEWGVIDGNMHARLSDLLPNPGSVEMVEIMVGRDYFDAHPELHEQVNSGAAE